MPIGFFGGRRLEIASPGRASVVVRKCGGQGRRSIRCVLALLPALTGLRGPRSEGRLGARSGTDNFALRALAA
jgi:hypothetical protein